MSETNQKSIIKILNSPAPLNQDEFNSFIASILHWIFDQSVFDKKTAPDRIKLFFHVLEKNNGLDEKLKNSFVKYAKGLDLFNLFSVSGINLHSSLTNELFDRFFAKFSFHHQTEGDIAHHFEHIISDENQIEWIRNLDDLSRGKIRSYLEFIFPREQINNYYNESISYLVAQLSAEGLDPKLHKRYFTEKINSSVFFQLNAKWTSLLKAELLEQTEVTQKIREEFEATLQECRQKIQSAPELFQVKGVDSDLVFKLEKIKSLEARISFLFKSKYQRTSPEEDGLFYYELLKAFVDQNKILNFASATFTVVAKQIITINAGKASDYIAKNKEHFVSLFKMALGGGALTAVTVIFKFLIAKTGLTGFWLGFFQMINYSSSFLLIHYLHFTLATKQPANTASRLADLMTTNQKMPDLNTIVEEVKSVLKSQVLSVLGNILAVVPMVMLFAYLYLFASGEHFLSTHSANYTLDSLKLVSLVPLYAIFTGIILWTAGLFGGWINNFFVFYDLDKLFSQKLKTKASSLFSALGSNIYLGFFLGVLPEILKFMQIPLDVRHITLSSGTLFLALPVLGFQNISWLAYFNIFLGLFVIAFFNIFTSFFLTIRLSFKASAISKERQLLIYRKLLKSLLMKG